MLVSPEWGAVAQRDEMLFIHWVAGTAGEGPGVGDTKSGGGELTRGSKVVALFPGSRGIGEDLKTTQGKARSVVAGQDPKRSKLTYF